MEQIHTVESAYHPNHKLQFLIDWLLTLKCNYDCTYCVIGPKGHDNRTKHPAVQKCITMLKQMYQYTDVMMQNKKAYYKEAILNVYGGEAIYHPNIVPILMQSTMEYEKKYSDRWSLKRRLTTNATAQPAKWKQICEHIEGVTFSYHTQGPDKLKTVFKKNIDHVVNIQKQYDIVILMYPHGDYWQDCLDFLQYCQTNKLNARPRLLDGGLGLYSQQQLAQLQELTKENPLMDSIKQDLAVEKQTRGCCGGRPLCVNRNLKQTNVMVPKTQGFENWHCSAHQFFLHGNCVNGEYYTNKDCRMKLDQTRGAIATVDTMPAYINTIDQQIKNHSLPNLVCKQKVCLCGTCAPKSHEPETLKKILKIYNLN